MASKIEPKVQEFEFRPARKTTKWQDFKLALYDPDKEEFFGRTKKGWYQLLIAYTVFYACLAALFAICMKGLTASLDDREPRWQLDESLIGTSPGMGFRPISEATEEGSLIRYNLNETETGQKWIRLLDDYLALYRVDQVGGNFQKCDYNMTAKEGNVCVVNAADFGDCTSENRYGYGSASPCVFVKLNRIFGWTPEVYTEAVDDMPADLKDLVAASENKTQVWISCQGENPFDRERIGGFRYFPGQGFPSYYFPYRNDPNYLSPLIAVQVLNVEHRVVVNVECRAWAKNIAHSESRVNREGSIHFEILVDPY